MSKLAKIQISTFNFQFPALRGGRSRIHTVSMQITFVFVHPGVSKMVIDSPIDWSYPESICCDADIASKIAVTSI